MRRPRRFDRRDTRGFGCTVVRSPRTAESETRKVPSQERPRRLSRRATAAPLILDAVRFSTPAHGRGLRPTGDRPVLAPARVLRTIPDRLADDRDLVELKLALLGAVLVLAAALR